MNKYTVAAISKPFICIYILLSENSSFSLYSLNIFMMNGSLELVQNYFILKYTKSKTIKTINTLLSSDSPTADTPSAVHTKLYKKSANNRMERSGAATHESEITIPIPNAKGWQECRKPPAFGWGAVEFHSVKRWCSIQFHRDELEWCL